MGRKLWVALHRCCGLVLMALLLVNALTGSLIAFEHELDAWLNPGLMRTGHARPPLPADELIARVEQSDARLRVGQFPLDGQPGESLELRIVPRINPATGKPHALGFDRLFIDPATGAVLGQRQWGAFKIDRLHLMAFLDVLHRKFHLPGKWGMWLTGGMALLWLLSSLVGACLTLPRAASWAGGFWRRWVPAWQIKRGASWSRTNFDLHRAAGLWSLPAAVLLAVSGVYFNLGDEVFRPVVRWFAPITPHPVQALPRRAPPLAPPAFATQEAVQRARAHLPPTAQPFLPWYASHIPQLGAYRIAFKEDGMRERLLRLRYEQVFIDDQTGALKGMSGYDSGSAADRLLIWQYPLHTGRILGWWGRVLVCITGLAVALLCGTGLLVWVSRRKARAASRRGGGF